MSERIGWWQTNWRGPSSGRVPNRLKGGGAAVAPALKPVVTWGSLRSSLPQHRSSASQPSFQIRFTSTLGDSFESFLDRQRIQQTDAHLHHRPVEPRGGGRASRWGDDRGACLGKLAWTSAALSVSTSIGCQLKGIPDTNQKGLV